MHHHAWLTSALCHHPVSSFCHSNRKRTEAVASTSLYLLSFILAGHLALRMLPRASESSPSAFLPSEPRELPAPTRQDTWPCGQAPHSHSPVPVLSLPSHRHTLAFVTHRDTWLRCRRMAGLSCQHAFAKDPAWGHTVGV